MPDWNPYSESADSAARRLATVTPNDAADLPAVAKALWVAVGGTVSLVPESEVANTGFSMGSLPAGTVIPVRTRRVRATGTSATVLALV